MSAMYASLSTFLHFAAMVLLIFISVSVPTWHAVSFLNVGPPGDDQLRYGVFGYTGSGTILGYHFVDIVVPIPIQKLTYALILYPIAAAFSFAAFLSALSGLSRLRHHRFGYHRSSTFPMLSALATAIITALWIMTLLLFIFARDRSSTPAEFGNAFWFILAAFLASLAATILSSLPSKRTTRKQTF